MGNTFYFNWEPQLMVALQNLLGEAGAAIATLVTMLGNEQTYIRRVHYIRRRNIAHFQFSL